MIIGIKIYHLKQKKLILSSLLKISKRFYSIDCIFISANTKVYKFTKLNKINIKEVYATVILTSFFFISEIFLSRKVFILLEKNNITYPVYCAINYFSYTFTK